MLPRRLLSCLLLAAAPAAAADTAAQAAVERMLAASGGPGAPYACDSIAFTFVVERDGKPVASRRHVWHPRSGDHTVTGLDKEGKEYRIEWNLHSRAGTALRAGNPVEGEERKALLERAWGLWVNDTYWLLMPYKLMDPGVNLAHEGEATLDGAVCDKVKVTFDGVGLTPGDTYWVWISRATNRVERWEFVLQGQQPPPVGFRWLDHDRRGPLTLSLRKEREDGAQVIRFTDVEVR